MDEKMKCPMCGSHDFYVKDPEDEYETYGLDMVGGNVVFNAEVEVSDAPELTEDSETYCDQCAWHGKLEELKK